MYTLGTALQLSWDVRCQYCTLMCHGKTPALFVVTVDVTAYLSDMYQIIDILPYRD